MTELTGRIVRAGDAYWDKSRRGFASAAPYDENVPSAIVFCQCSGDVVNAVNWARENHRPLRVRCGRHNYEAFSSLVKDGIVIDVSEMASVSVSNDCSSAVVGAGACLFELSEALSAVGVTMPLATGAGVGISGLTLGGGFGLTTRKWGLTCDSLECVEIVLADGRTIRADSVEYDDLFWACCGGGGGSFGIVTEFTYKVYPVANVALFSASYPWSAFVDVVDRFQHWTGEVDHNVTAFLTLLSAGVIELHGQCTANDYDLGNVEAHIGPMLELALQPTESSVRILPHTHASRIVLGLDPQSPDLAGAGTEQIFKSTSAFVYEPLPGEAIAKLQKGLESVPLLTTPPSQPSMVQLLGGGGAAARRERGATAAYHRQARLVVQYDGYWSAPEDGDNTIAWVQNLRDALAPYTAGAYVNYADATLDSPLEQYFGSNLPRLIAIKRKYDPENLFRFPQSIPHVQTPEPY